MTAELPLPTLLSQLLVALTIEFDNEFEHRMPYRTSRPGPSPATATGPWLVSQVMWSNVMQFVDEGGVSVAIFTAGHGPTGDSVGGLERWGYVTVVGEPIGGGSRPPGSVWVVRPTRYGRPAQGVRRPPAGTIEERWQERFGRDEIGSLRDALLAVIDQLEVDLPRYLPVVHPTQIGRADLPRPRAADEPAGSTKANHPDLSVLPSQVLLAFTVDFESESRISLPISANTLRVLDEEGVRVRDLPVRSSPLARGLEPYPDGWRASVRRPALLPHHPMVLHPGGYPDGS